MYWMYCNFNKLSRKSQWFKSRNTLCQPRKCPLPFPARAQKLYGETKARPTERALNAPSVGRPTPHQRDIHHNDITADDDGVWPFCQPRGHAVGVHEEHGLGLSGEGNIQLNNQELGSISWRGIDHSPAMAIIQVLTAFSRHFFCRRMNPLGVLPSQL